MRFWAASRRLLFLAILAAGTYTGWTFFERRRDDERWKAGLQRPANSQREADFQRTYGGSDLKILQFYARDAMILEGGQTVVCYGVWNARAVRIDPPLAAGMRPSLNLCLDAAPERTTHYTLTAEGANGGAATASLEIQVRPDPAELPRITYFRADKERVEDGRRIVRLAFGQVNGALVEIEPPVFPALHRTPVGQFYVAPRETTTYVLTVTGKHGHKTRQSLTVNIPPA